MKTLLMMLLLIVVIPICSATESQDVKYDGPCVRKVFVTGRQSVAVAWANDNLSKKTCMVAVATPDEADVILDLEPNIQPMTKLEYEPGDPGYFVQCSGTASHTRCVDANGTELSSSCSFGRNGQVECS